jgi:hypothetical protein
MPARKIKTASRSITGAIPTLKNKQPAEYESALEGDLFCLLEFDQEVASFECQPVTIHYEDASHKTRRYTPDALVFYKDAQTKPMLVETKYRADLWANWPTLKPKFRAALDYAHSNGWRFKILTEVEIRTPALYNARFLLGYRYAEIDSNHVFLLQRTLHSLRIATVKETLIASSRDEWRQAQLLHALWFMAAGKLVGFDNTKRLGMDSEIWLS